MATAARSLTKRKAIKEKPEMFCELEKDNSHAHLFFKKKISIGRSTVFCTVFHFFRLFQLLSIEVHKGVWIIEDVLYYCYYYYLLSL